MYPAIANCKDIPARKTKILQFKKRGKSKSLVSPAQIIPAVNISETGTEYHIILATPGLRRENFNIEIAESVLTISAKKENTPLGWINDRCEYDYTDWTRAFALPADADSLLARAEYQNGELIIHIPRCDTSENKAKAIIYVY